MTTIYSIRHLLQSGDNRKNGAHQQNSHHWNFPDKAQRKNSQPWNFPDEAQRKNSEPYLNVYVRL